MCESVYLERLFPRLQLWKNVGQDKWQRSWPTGAWLPREACCSASDAVQWRQPQGNIPFPLGKELQQ